MKRFTIVFSLLLVFGFVATLLYVAALPEFVPPAQFTMGRMRIRMRLYGT